MKPNKQKNNQNITLYLDYLRARSDYKDRRDIVLNNDIPDLSSCGVRLCPLNEL
jgi:hypothetical protein